MTGEQLPEDLPPAQPPAAPEEPVPPPEPPGGEPPSPGPEPKPEPGSRRTGTRLRDLVETVLVAVLIVLFMTTFAVQNSVIPSASMVDTLLVGDYILVNKVAFSPVDAASPSPAFAMRPVRHGDIVVFKHPDDPATAYIKRVVGLEGDLVEIRNKSVVRNGAPVDEPWAVHRSAIVQPRGGGDGSRDNFGPVRVPPGTLFVMGDNRDYSRDSREFGFVPRELVTGRAFVIFWSRSRPPGTFQSGRPSPRRLLASLRTFHRDVRWSRIFRLVE